VARSTAINVRKLTRIGNHTCAYHGTGTRNNTSGVVSDCGQRIKT